MGKSSVDYVPYWPQSRPHYYLWDDEFKGFATTANSGNWNSLIERCQLTTFVNRQSQEVHIGDLNMCDDRIGLEDLKDADILSPEVIA